MGMNTIRLEGKEEHPELYDVADRLGLMVMPGWECCDKWEAWTYNDEVTATLWVSNRRDDGSLRCHTQTCARCKHTLIIHSSDRRVRTTLIQQMHL